MACKFHPDRESVAMCVTCGAELCEECRHVGADGKSYCAEHLPQEVEMPPRAAPEGAPAAAGNDSTGLAAACYFSWILAPLSFVIPIIALVSSGYKESRYMRYHAYNGLFWGIAVIVIGVVLAFVQIFLGITGLGVLARLIGLVLNVYGLAALIASIMFAIKASNRQEVKIPVISDLAEKQAG